MGEEAPEYLLGGPGEFLPIEFDSDSRDSWTSTAVGERIYVVGGSSDGANWSTNVKIFDKATGKWLIPTILGIEPLLCENHLAVLLNEDRILILKQASLPNDCTWFLEVDTTFVKEQKKIIGTEVVAWSKGIEGDGPKPVVISGPSGVGKGTLISKLMEEFPSSFGFSVSHTTRAPRENEKDGIHYHFTERSIMEKDIRDGKFLESASVHGNLYGTSIEAVEAVTDAGKRCILDIDVQGATSVRDSSLEVVSIFISPPSFQELEKRLRSRGTETEEQVLKRLRNAREEVDKGNSLGLFHHILLNDNLETCYENLKKKLGLDKSTDAAYQPSLKNFERPMFHYLSKTNQGVLVQCGTTELGKTPPSSFMLDVSSLKGGAPGRTRGLKLYAVVPLSVGLDGIKQLEEFHQLSS